MRNEVIATVRRFVARDVIPIASELEHADAYPEVLVEQMKALGLFGVTIPEEYGGLGLDLLTYVGIVEELSYGWMSLSGIVNTHTMCATNILRFGTEAQKRKWLPDLSAGVKRDPAEIEKEIVALVRDRIGPVAAFRTAVSVKRLPKTRSGKILRGTMQKIADGETWNMPATIDDPAILEEIGTALKGKTIR